MAELTAQELSEAQAKEYGTYVATEQILIGGALAFRKGDPVPKSHVDREVVESSQVAKATTKAGQQAVEEK